MENEDWRKFVKDNKLDWINISDFPDANENAMKYIYENQVTDLCDFRLIPKTKCLLDFFETSKDINHIYGFQKPFLDVLSTKVKISFVLLQK